MLLLLVSSIYTLYDLNEFLVCEDSFQVLRFFLYLRENFDYAFGTHDNLAVVLALALRGARARQMTTVIILIFRKLDQYAFNRELRLVSDELVLTLSEFAIWRGIRC